MMSSSVFPERTEGTGPQEGTDPYALLEAALGTLDGSAVAWLRRVTVVASGRSVVLRGTVPSYYLRQLAQVTVTAVPGVEGERNEIRVGDRR